MGTRGSPHRNLSGKVVPTYGGLVVRGLVPGGRFGGPGGAFGGPGGGSNGNRNSGKPLLLPKLKTKTPPGPPKPPPGTSPPYHYVAPLMFEAKIIRVPGPCIGAAR